MCTVSYIPTASGYILTSNRDEDPMRTTQSPEPWTLPNGIEVVGPRDLESGGTWIATDEFGRSACLLNGAFSKHKRQLPYQKSRGRMIPESFSGENFLQFMVSVDPEGVEPFTLILIDEELQVLKWDGKKRHIHFLSRHRPHLWSSATLYDSRQHLEKLERFEKFVSDPHEIHPRKILQLHGLTEPNNFVISRKQVRTVSITQINAGLTQSVLNYYIPDYLQSS